MFTFVQNICRWTKPQAPDKEVMPTKERLQQRIDKLNESGEHRGVKSVLGAIDNLYFLAMMHDGTLFQHTHNQTEADMLLDAYVVLKHFTQEHGGYVSPLPLQQD